MSLKRLAITLVAALAPAAAQPPLPGLRVEPVSGGTVFYVKNTASQPLTAFILELAGYPGSGYVLVQDESSSEPIPPGEREEHQLHEHDAGCGARIHEAAGGHSTPMGPRPASPRRWRSLRSIAAPCWRPRAG